MGAGPIQIQASPGPVRPDFTEYQNGTPRTVLLGKLQGAEGKANHGGSSAI